MISKNLNHKSHTGIRKYFKKASDGCIVACLLHREVHMFMKTWNE